MFIVRHSLRETTLLSRSVRWLLFFIFGSMLSDETSELVLKTIRLEKSVTTWRNGIQSPFPVQTSEDTIVILQF